MFGVTRIYLLTHIRSYRQFWIYCLYKSKYGSFRILIFYIHIISSIRAVVLHFSLCKVQLSRSQSFFNWLSCIYFVLKTFYLLPFYSGWKITPVYRVFHVMRPDSQFRVYVNIVCADSINKMTKKPRIGNAFIVIFLIQKKYIFNVNLFLNINLFPWPFNLRSLVLHIKWEK